MKNKTRYTDETIGPLRVVEDFLPAPEDLVLKDDGVKVTIALSRRSVVFFKNQAVKHHTQYQRMIRRLLDAYVEIHAGAAAPKLVRRPSRSRIALGRTSRTIR